MPQVADRVVGRAAELSAIDDALTTGQTLLFSGEPGIGKTRLLAELAARADARGWLVLAGSASELESDLPFWTFVDALDEYVAGLDPRRLETLGEGVAAELAQVLPGLTARERAPAGTDQRYLAHGAVRTLLERLTVGTPLVLVLDDLHWADPASIDLLAGLLRRPPSGRVVLALATRPRQLPDRLARALDGAQRRDALRRIDLAGLTHEEATELLGIGGGRAEALYAESGGNPFYLEQLARSTGGAHAELTLRGVEVPAAVLTALGDELALLPEAARRVLDGAAVAGDPFEPELAAAAAGIDEPAAAEPLDHLLGFGLVRTTDVPRRFRFRHPLVRRAVYESAPAAWRLGAHERCADALGARGAPAAARAHHVEHAARQGDLAAVAVLTEAAEVALPRAPASAAAWLQAALRALPETAPPDQRAHLLMTRAKACATSRRLRDAHADVVAALDLVPVEATAWWVALTVAAGSLEHRLGMHAQARGRLAGALQRLPDRDSPEAVDLLIELAIGDLFRTRYASMLDWATQAVDVARRLDDRLLLAKATATAALAEAFSGSGTGSSRTEAAALVDAMPYEELARAPAAVGYLAGAHVFEDCYEDALAVCEHARALERETGHTDPTVSTTHALARTMLGRLDVGARELDDAIELMRVVGIAQGLAFHLAHRTFLAIAAGDDDTALSAAEEAYEVAGRLDVRFMSAWTTTALAAALLETGKVERALTLLGVDAEHAPVMPGPWRVLVVEMVVRGCVATGRLEEARRAAAFAGDLAEAMAAPMATAWAARAAAEVALSDGDLAGAVDHARSAVGAAVEAGAVVEAARARVMAGRALAAAGDADAAADELEAAAASFGACGAVRRRDAAEQELRRLGRPVRRVTAPGAREGVGLEALTGRERQVADLVVDRHTNPEIAAELFLSLKTVETHLRNIFRKLGVSSRVELARVVERARRES